MNRKCTFVIYHDDNNKPIKCNKRAHKHYISKGKYTDLLCSQHYKLNKVLYSYGRN